METEEMRIAETALGGFFTVASLVLVAGVVLAF
jgi:hypothetical protein